MDLFKSRCGCGAIFTASVRTQRECDKCGEKHRSAARAAISKKTPREFVARGDKADRAERAWSTWSETFREAKLYLDAARTWRPRTNKVGLGEVGRSPSQLLSWAVAVVRGADKVAAYETIKQEVKSLTEAQLKSVCGVLAPYVLALASSSDEPSIDIQRLAFRAYWLASYSGAPLAAAEAEARRAGAFDAASMYAADLHRHIVFAQNGVARLLDDLARSLLAGYSSADQTLDGLGERVGDARPFVAHNMICAWLGSRANLAGFAAELMTAALTSSPP